jgi:hypothetical protein
MSELVVSHTYRESVARRIFGHLSACAGLMRALPVRFAQGQR